MSEPMIGELFVGYGGLGMAVQAVYGGKLAWYSEFDDAPSRIMAHHHPGVPNYGDVTAIDWDEVPRVDILTGGFPCQDVSVAGRRAGMTDGTRSGLWSHMAHAIDVLRPQLVVIENVGGLFSAQATRVMEPHPWCLGDDGTGEHTVFLRAIDAVLSTLSELGYDAEWTALRAADVGAPHGRLRVFITAHPQGVDGRVAPGGGDNRTPAHPRGGGSGGWASLPFASGKGEPHPAPLGTDHRPDTPGSTPGLTLLPTPAAVRAGRQKSASAGAAIRPTLDSIHRLLPTPRTTDMNGAGHHGTGGMDLRTAAALLPTPRATDGTKGGPNQAGSSGDLMLPSAVQPERFGPYAPAVQRWEHILGRSAPAPTEPGKNRPRLASRFVEWLMGLDAGHVTGVGLTRNQELKALGNGVVPLQGAAALRHLHTIRTTYPEEMTS